MASFEKKEGEDMTSDIMVVAALGRPFTLGMLYDGRKDQLIPGLLLWDEASVQHKTSLQHSSKLEITAGDTIESKSSLLDIDASLKASFMSGLVEVGGSAKYLNDTKKFKNQSRVTFQYHATTHFKQVSMIDLETRRFNQTKAFKKRSATHVVTGILYGANAFFVFESDKLEEGSIRDIQGRMEGVMKKIPRFNVEGKVEIKLTEEEKILTDKFKCRFYGDFILEKNPATFEDAVKTYIELPKLLGEQGERSVPLKVWLMPLKNLDPDAAELLSEVSNRLVEKMQEALDDFREIEMRCNNSLDDPFMENFPLIQKELKTFKRHCSDFTSNLLRNMANKLPSIREGKEDESSAKQLLEDRHKSAFSHEKLSKWLDDKEREVNVIRSCVDIMKGIKIVQSKSELDREVLAAGVEQALCFVFTSLESPDPRLDAMTDYLESRDGRPSEDVWYHSDNVLTEMREKAKTFHSFAQNMNNKPGHKFLIAAINNEKHEGASIYQYKNGILLTDDFSLPDITDVTKLKNREDVVIYACQLTLDPDTAYNILILSEGDTKVTMGKLDSFVNRRLFSYQPQVLCREGLTGRCYWEVELTGRWCRVGVCYKGMSRKGVPEEDKLGTNAVSWSLYSVYSNEFCPTAWHDKKHEKISVNVVGISRLGVYLDWSAGTLSYYQVSSDRLTHIYTFYTHFTEPVYPAFGFEVFGDSDSIQLVPCSVNV